MSKVAPETVAQSARRYVGLRRLYWRSFLGLWGVWAVFALPLSALDSRLPAGVRNVLFGAFFSVFLGCFLTACLSWSRLARFRCPRCDGLFLMSWGSSWPTSACKHCGLDLGSSRKPDPEVSSSRDLGDGTFP